MADNERVNIPTVRGGNDFEVPLVGFGTSGVKGIEAATAVEQAARAGYRLFDTATQYGNEASVAHGLTRSGVAREDVIFTTKVAGVDQGRELTKKAIGTMLERTGFDYLDLVLIHWPNPSRGLALETWQQLIQARDEGTVRHIGVSNFRPDQLTELHEATGVWPELNQIQLSPALPRQEAVRFHAEHDIITEAWGPLGGREGLGDQFAVRRVAEKHDRTPAQVILRWIVQQGIVAIPKSAKPERQIANASIFDFTLDDDDIALLASVDLGEENAWDSRRHEEW